MIQKHENLFKDKINNVHLMLTLLHQINITLSRIYKLFTLFIRKYFSSNNKYFSENAAEEKVEGASL